VLHCNPRFSEIFGWPHGELVGQPGSVFYLSDKDYAEIGRIATPLLSSGGMLDHELPMRRKDGRAIFCHMRAKAINPQNTAEGTIWIIEDISERKRAESRLQELLHKQQAILEYASLGIMFTSNGKIVHCNPRFDAILDWPVGSLEGRMAEVIFRSHEDYVYFGQTVGPRLVDGEHKGRYQIGYVSKSSGTQLSRADGADFVLKELTEMKWLKKLPVTSY